MKARNKFYLITPKVNIMKKLILLTISVLTLSLATATNVKAENRLEHLDRVMMSNNTVSADLSPFELVSRAYQGEYSMQGISGFGSFSSGITSGRITARDLIRAATEAQQLSSELATDPSYQRAVATLLIGRQH
jgi:hypothetical protein